ncbi:Panacea domain-containing protein [Pontibacter kalidii]|uniref:Panacea domain-containing protein n=1 Tax=Pontibacter kalidii TaxID=2592049 RepID=UPI0022539794|nr:type II toxin-antitoxin system antitoxin SocA domain-containing protein [Pontibacter kalidii]
MLTAKDIAEYLLRLSDSEASDITNLKIQKLLYYVQGFNLAMHGEKMFNDPIEAWQYGPVVADLYHAYKGNGSGVISPSNNYEFTRSLTEEEEELILEVNDVYGQFSGPKLMHMTHEERPWLEAIEKKNKEINLNTMQVYFKQLLTE